MKRANCVSKMNKSQLATVWQGKSVKTVRVAKKNLFLWAYQIKERVRLYPAMSRPLRTTTVRVAKKNLFL